MSENNREFFYHGKVLRLGLHDHKQTMSVLQVNVK